MTAGASLHLPANLTAGETKEVLRDWMLMVAEAESSAGRSITTAAQLIAFAAAVRDAQLTDFADDGDAFVLATARRLGISWYGETLGPPPDTESHARATVEVAG